MHAGTSIARHPLMAFAITIALAFASTALMLWMDNAAQAADSLQVVDLFSLLDE